MCLWRGRKNLEEHFPYHNWLIVLVLQLVISTAYSVMNSSIYQFITTPHSLPEELENDEDASRFWPGLGGTDTDYALVVAAYSIFEMALYPIIGVLADRLPYTVLTLLFLSMIAIGGVLYALAVSVWMAFLGRGVIGGAGSFGAAVVHMYMGEMGTVMDKARKKQRKRPIKFSVYIAYSFILNGGYFMAYAFTAIVAQFPGVNPYRWPGWFLVVQSAAMAVVVVLFFREPRPLSRMKRPCRIYSCLTGFQLSAQLKSQWKTRFLCYLFLVVCGYMIGQVYALITTLITPIMSDQFGFNVEYTSYFLTGAGVAFSSASILQLGTKVAKLDNRIVLGMAFIFSLIGFVLIGDWQAISDNPCSLASSNMSVTVSGQYNNDSENWLWFSGFSGDISTTAESYGAEYSNSTSNSSLDQQSVENCEALGNSSAHQCYWNPISRVTGKFCNTCLPICLSKQLSLNFYQFSLGIFLLCLSCGLGFVFVSAITSDITSVESQGALLSLVLGSGAFARAVSPFWFVESYELTGRHTYPSMAVTAGGSVVILICLVALYKSLAPKSSLKERVDATSKLETMEQDMLELEDEFVFTERATPGRELEDEFVFYHNEAADLW